MAKRNNHYEAAFEAYLRQQAIPYVAVDEQRRSFVAGDRSVKSLDFLVSPRGSRWKYLIDVKGRRFDCRPGGNRWLNWTMADDLHGLAHWEQLFGTESRALLVFAYNIVGNRSPFPLEQLFVFRGRLYAFLGISLDLYLGWSRQVSVRWQTHAMPSQEFRRLAQPIAEAFRDTIPAEMAG